MKGSSRAAVFGFFFGALSCAICTAALAVWAAFNLADWLVVDDGAHRADVAVVLDGGSGSRLRKGIDLYDQGLVDALVLVGPNEWQWDARLQRLCPGCKTGAKPLTMLTGSKNTLTDAELVHAYCVEKGINQILVVTDPYHTRRASLTFKRQFTGSGIEVTMVSSGDYRELLSPNSEWWRDERTFRTVWTETAKVAGIALLALSDPG